MKSLTTRRQYGTAMLEFAIVAPLLVFLLLAIAEFGNALNQYITVTKAVRDGARYAAEEAMFGDLAVVDLDRRIDGGLTIRQRTQNLVVYGLPVVSGDRQPLLADWSPTGDVTVSEVGVDHVQVSAIYQYTPLLGTGASLPTFGFGDKSISLAFTFTASTLMKAL